MQANSPADAGRPRRLHAVGRQAHGDAQASAARHGVPGVNRQVHEHLLDHADVDVDPWRRARLKLTTIASPRSRRSMPTMASNSVFRSMTSRFGTRLRLKSSSWRTSPVACRLAVKTRLRASLIRRKVLLVEKHAHVA